MNVHRRKTSETASIHTILNSKLSTSDISSTSRFFFKFSSAFGNWSFRAFSTLDSCQCRLLSNTPRHVLYWISLRLPLSDQYSTDCRIGQSRSAVLYVSILLILQIDLKKILVVFIWCGESECYSTECLKTIRPREYIELYAHRILVVNSNFADLVRARAWRRLSGFR